MVLTVSVYVCASNTETHFSGGGRISHFADGPLAQVTE
jgi:hypothetical protein